MPAPLAIAVLLVLQTPPEYRPIGRTHVFHADTLIGTHLDVVVSDDLLPSPRLARYPGGEWIVVGARMARDARHPVPIVVQHDGGRAEEIATLNRADSLRPGIDPESGLTTYVPQPVHAGDLWAPLPGESPGVAILNRPVPREGEAASARLVVVNLQGDTVRVIRFSNDPKPVPREAYDREITAIVERAMRGRPFPEAQVRRSVGDAIIRYTHQPLFDRLVVGRQGTLCLGESAFGRRYRNWSFYDPGGTAIGRLWLDSADEILAVDHPRLWVVRYGDLDEPYILRIRLTEP